MKKSKFSLTYKDEALADLVSRTDHKTLGIWAMACAERVMFYFEAKYAEDHRPRHALTTLKTWIDTGELSIGDLTGFQKPVRSVAKCFVCVILLLLLIGCQQEATQETATAVPTTATIPPTETPMPEIPFRIIAYVTASITPETIPYNRLTHINYAFLIPNPDGTFAPFANGWKLKNIVEQAHAADVKVLISVGGWGWEKEFEAMAADPTTRAAFVQNLADFVAEYGLDGADIDWEYPQAGESAQNFLALIQELRTTMPDKLLTTAVVSYGNNAEGVPNETFPIFDFINVMTYDGPDHGTMSQFQTGLDYWQGRGLPPEKTVMGVPFYSRPSEAIYRKIIEADPQAAYSDTIEWNGVINQYNGIPTIQNKTEIAMERAGGIMFWTLDHDATDDLSLLKAIDEMVHQR